MSIQKVSRIIAVVTLTFSGVTFGQTQVPNDFTAGTPARAAEVNENFDTLEAAVDQNAAAIQQNPAGPQGDSGPAGEVGPQGLTGDTGPQGPAGGPVEAGSIGLAEIDPTQVQIRVGGSCAVGSFVAALAEDGSVTCGTGSSDDGFMNTRYGSDALASNTTGSLNTAHGYRALYSNTGGSENTAQGHLALNHNTTGSSNTAHGYRALYRNTDGSENTAQGHIALSHNTTGSSNTAHGDRALYSNTGGSENTAQGNSALKYNTTGVENTAQGHIALYNNTTGSSNIALGSHAGQNLTTGNFNIAIGNDGVAGEANTTRVGTSGRQNRTFVSGIRGVAPGIPDAVSVVIDSQGQLGTVSSSGRYKQDIADMGQASNRLLQLRPVKFRYKKPYENSDKPLEFGLIAEEVANVFPELVVLNEDNQPETVKYRLLSSLLLNELQKQNTSLKRQEGEVAKLKAQVAELYKLAGQVAQLTEPTSDLVATNATD